VHAVKGQQDQNDEIRNQEREIEGVRPVEAFESRIQKMCAEVMPQAMRFGKNGA